MAAAERPSLPGDGGHRLRRGLPGAEGAPAKNEVQAKGRHPSRGPPRVGAGRRAGVRALVQIARVAGAHPWEIVFAHPHGILLSPYHEGGRWRFHLSVDTLGLYVDAARMATALGERGVPFELFRADEMIAALRGEDWVEVGPFRSQLSLGELEERRPGATAHVFWDDPPRLLRRSSVKKK